MFDLMIITEGANDDIVERTRMALRGTPTKRIAVQLRDKTAPHRVFYEVACKLRDITNTHGAAFVINGRADVAVAVGADGVHLPSNGMRPDEARSILDERTLVGTSTHNERELESASLARVHYALLSPYAPSPGKGEALGSSGFSRLAAGPHPPIFALGGIDETNGKEALRAGAVGLAVVRAVYGSHEPNAAVLGLLRVLDTHAQKTG